MYLGHTVIGGSEKTQKQIESVIKIYLRRDVGCCAPIQHLHSQHLHDK